VGVHLIIMILCLLLTLAAFAADTPDEIAALHAMSITPERLMPPALETDLVKAGEPAAVICHADVPQWHAAAQQIARAIQESTGVAPTLMTDAEYERQPPATLNAILVGHLDNNRVVARLYHNFFVCLDAGTPRSDGYEIRTVHNPFGDARNFILVGGSTAESTQAAAEAFGQLVAANGRPGELRLGRILVVRQRGQGGQWVQPGFLSDEERDRAIAEGRKTMFSPGQGRSGVAALVRWGARYHHTGDPNALQAYAALMAALLEYYNTDSYITAGPLGRYDRDFRDAWTYTVGILWDLNEESGAFSDEQRLQYTNLLIRLAYECVRYQGYDRPETFQMWLKNTGVVHNHNTFPALGLYFVGRYLKWHYGFKPADDWLAVAAGIFRGLKHSSKPLEDAAGYQWLPIMHVMTYSLAEGDPTFFEEGHAREAARSAMMVMDNAGYQAAYGDHEAEKSASGLGETLQKIAWYYQSPQILWGAQRASLDLSRTLEQAYNVRMEPREPTDLPGLQVSRLPQLCYDHIATNPQYPVRPNLPLAETFDKLTLRDGLQREDAYLLLDGFGRGNHMHFDANAIIRYAYGGEPLLVDGEYIRNAPKHHSSLVILRDGQSELTPAVTGLGPTADLGALRYSRTYLRDYNGTDWHRTLLWRNGRYFVVSDLVQAKEPGTYTLRCCWRPWGDVTLEGGRATALHGALRLIVQNADGAPCRSEVQKIVGNMPVNRLSQQVSVPLKPGESYRFLNLVYADRIDQPRDVHCRRIGLATMVVEGAQGSEVACFDPAHEPPAGLACDGDALVLTATGFCAVEARKVADLLTASAPVSVDVDYAAGKATLTASEPATVTLRLAAGAKAALDGQAREADAAGVLTCELAPGTHALTFNPLAPPETLTTALATLAAAPELAAGGQTAPAGGAAKPAWMVNPFQPRPMLLPLASVTCTQPTDDRRGPVDRLIDAAYSASYYSAMWPAGVTPTITAELKREAMIRRVILREWHMNSAWDIGERHLEISNDEFFNDTRRIDGPFEEVGTQAWGGNVNTLMAVHVDQPARYLRLTVSPARPECAVYLAELQVEGADAGTAPNVTSLTTGELNGDGHPESVTAGDAGEIVALDADGKTLWSFARPGQEAVNAVACADVNGDGKAEVIAGGDGAWLALLSSDGKLLWETKLPQYRGIAADVRAVVGADLDGDGKPEVAAGTASWEVFAFDAAGKKLWDYVFYAHAATVLSAADFDGDGREEIVCGNAYYRCDVVDDDGKRLLYGQGNIGPEQSAAAAADVDGDGKPEILLGTDGGSLHCFDGDGKMLWEANLGDRVTRILPLDLDGDGQPELACSAESAHVFAVGRDGAILWRTSLPDGGSDLAVLRGADGALTLAAAAGSAGVAFLNAQGRLLSTVPTPAAANLLVAQGAAAIVADTKGGVSAVPAPR
jgi:outer membrane protein assembly factor BamB